MKRTARGVEQAGNRVRCERYTYGDEWLAGREIEGAVGKEFLDTIGVDYDIEEAFGVFCCQILVYGCVCYVIDYLDNTSA